MLTFDVFRVVSIVKHPHIPEVESHPVNIITSTPDVEIHLANPITTQSYGSSS
jgi:hypothetical protein